MEDAGRSVAGYDGILEKERERRGKRSYQFLPGLAETCRGLQREVSVNDDRGQQSTSRTGDEYILDTPAVRSFISRVRAAIARSRSPAEAVQALRSPFAELLEDEDWLPREYQHPVPESGMGGGIGQWLLFRSGARDLSLFSLVVPSGSATPVHDHLAWGLVGLYRGEQEETVYAWRGERGEDEPGVESEDTQELKETLSRPLERGDFYQLLPPTDDIHAVRTTSAEPSVSIHLLSNDTGCIWRHVFDPETSEVSPFRSGYVNRPCGE
jgi:predicted metal-dependent enzyme (double-stranded beta helix superfamily)